MTTLIAVYNSEGCIGRCDARCYDAHDEPCDCICAGWNHSAGLEQATDNTRELTELWVEQARAAGQDITRTELAGRSYCPGGAVRAGCTQWDFVSAIPASSSPA